MHMPLVRASELGKQLADGVLEGGGGVAVRGGHGDLELQPLRLLHLHPHHHWHLPHHKNPNQGEAVLFAAQTIAALSIAPVSLQQILLRSQKASIISSRNL